MVKDRDAEAQAEEEMKRRGVVGEITMSREISTQDTVARNSTVYLGTVVTVHAAGTLGF